MENSVDAVSLVSNFLFDNNTVVEVDVYLFSGTSTVKCFRPARGKRTDSSRILHSFL